MYLSFYKLAQKPFQINTEPDFLWLGETHDEALSVLKYGVMNRSGILLLTGDVGTGKTTLVNKLLGDLDDDVVAGNIVHSRIDLLGFLNLVGQAFNFPGRFSKIDQFLAYFNQFLRNQYLRGRHVLLIVDEAHKLSPKILEQTRLLSNISVAGENLVSIFLVGQNELNKHLLSAQNRALRQRITIHYQLKPLSPVETGQYCRHRLNLAGGRSEIFNPQAIKEIHRFSRGYPRLINIICERALIAGYANGQRAISPEVITECTRELMIPGEIELGSAPAYTTDQPSAHDSAPVISTQSRVRSMHHRLKEQAAQLRASVTDRLAARSSMRVSMSSAKKRGRPGRADEATVPATVSPDRTREIGESVLAEITNIERVVRRISSRILDSGLGNTALAVGSVILALTFSFWHQGIIPFQSTDQLPNSLLMQSIPATAGGSGYKAKTNKRNVDRSAAVEPNQIKDPNFTEEVSPDRTAEKGGSSRLTQKAKPGQDEKVAGQIVPVNAAYKIDKLNMIAVEEPAAQEAAQEIGPTLTNPGEMAFFSRQTMDAGQSGNGKFSTPRGLSRQSKINYALQVGAFLIEENAARRMTMLKERGYLATIVNFVDSKGRKWYSVRLGKFTSLRVAEKQANEFTVKEKMDSIVRPVGRF